MPLNAKANTSTAKAEATQPGKDGMQASEDTGVASHSSDSEELSSRLPSLFSPAARVKSLMDVCLISFLTLTIGLKMNAGRIKSRVRLPSRSHGIGFCLSLLLTSLSPST